MIWMACCSLGPISFFSPHAQSSVQLRVRTKNATFVYICICFIPFSSNSQSVGLAGAKLSAVRRTIVQRKPGAVYLCCQTSCGQIRFPASRGTLVFCHQGDKNVADNRYSV